MIAIRTARKGAAMSANSTAVPPDRSPHSRHFPKQDASRAEKSEIRALGSCMASEIRSVDGMSAQYCHVPYERTVSRHGPFSRSTLTAEKPKTRNVAVRPGGTMTAVCEPVAGLRWRDTKKKKTGTGFRFRTNRIQLSRRGSYRLALLCPSIAISGFIECAVEIFRRVPKGDPQLAVRCATIGFAGDPAIHDDVIDRTLDLHQLIREHFAGSIERDQVGDAVSFAGHHHGATGLDRYVGDQRVSDHHRGRALRNLGDRRLVDEDVDHFFRSCSRRRDLDEGEGDGEPCAAANRNHEPDIDTMLPSSLPY